MYNKPKNMSMTKTFTLLFAAAALVCGSVAADAAPARAKLLSKKKTERVVRNRARALDVVREANVKYLPLKEVVSNWDEKNEVWVEAILGEYSYDAYGRTQSMIQRDLLEGGDLMRVSYEYDESGNIVLQFTEQSADEGATWRGSERRVKVYDTVVKNFATENLVYMWYNNSWTLMAGNKYPISRSANGLITSVARQANLGEIFDDIAKVENTLSDDGKSIVASAITEVESLDSWEEVLDLRNITWHNTDGQVMAFDVDDYARGNNRVASAESYYEGALDATLTGTYANDFEGTLRFDFTDGSVLEISSEYTDEATGSFVDTYAVKYWTLPEDEEDINGDGIIDENDVVLVYEVETYAVTYDEHGNVVKEESAMYIDDELLFNGGIINEYVYNDNGAVTQMTSYGFEFDEEERWPDVLINVTDFYEFAGVADVVADGCATITVAGRVVTVNAAAASTFTLTALDGKTVATAAGEGSYTVSLDGLASGIYIATVSTGTDTVTSKIVLR